ncbi:chloroplast lipoate protein ligase [Irpex rosettiformis]|uniref:Chloroplast lipoate protein ligase n=1 Tax=Irpex rosettiformis TaxID=378272 RepID=A0ACB8U6I6_9APHY|nr:chloroplast lipoate protein ligase [Irpex rosettiformis]
MSLPPILYHCFRTPLPYRQTLALQERLHELQLRLRRENAHQDVLLLLEHRPVYTLGRRQDEHDPATIAEGAALQRTGADVVPTKRGGQITYHGPGQIVGYPLLDLGRTHPPIGIRDYICKMQTTLKSHLKEAHGIESSLNDNTGVFLDEMTKIASIGVQVRHRLTTHGFSINVTPEPMLWFKNVVACGLVGVRQGNIAENTKTKARNSVTVAEEMEGLAQRFGKVFGRDMVQLELAEREIGPEIAAVEEEAEALQQVNPWPRAPLLGLLK